MERRDHAAIAALPLAAASTLALVGLLPVRFRYRPNSLGIVSPSTMLEYPLQKETFWYVFGVGVAVLLALALAAALRGSYRAWQGITLEAIGVATLVAVLSLAGTGLRALAVAAGVAGAVALARAMRRSGTADPRQTLEPVPRGRLPTRWLAVYALAAAAFVGWAPRSFREPLTRDEVLARANWVFMAEDGQHLAWAWILHEGGFQGRDYFSLYGPYYDLGVAALWKAFGSSVGIWTAYQTSGRIAGTFAALLLAGMFCRHRVVALLPVALAIPPYIRHGWGLFGLACLFVWLRSGAMEARGRSVWVAAAGAIAGISLLFSQEFGLAYVVCAAFVLAVKSDGRAAAVFAAGATATASPLLLWYGMNGALGPLLYDLVTYPSYLMAGFGDIPFPDLLASLPVDLFRYPPPDSYLLRAGYAAPAVCAAGLVLALPSEAIRRLSPLRILREGRRALAADPTALLLVATAAYGLLSYRSALGRSDLGHLSTVVGVPGILLAVAADRVLSLARAGRAALAVAAWRAAGLVFLVLAGALTAWAEPLVAARRTAEGLVAVAREPLPEVVDPEVDGVKRWILEHTAPEDRVYFLPNNAAYYYLTRRRGPTRWVVSHQMVTDAHRDEAMAALRANPPRFVVYDPTMSGLDGIHDSVVFGTEMLDWLENGWIEVARFGDASILRPLRADERPCPRPPLEPPRPLHISRPGC